MIEFIDVVKTYDQGNTALNGVTMQIEDGEFCFLVVLPAPVSPPSSS